MSDYNNIEVPISTDPREMRYVNATLKFDTPKEKEGKYGPYYIYGCKDDNGQDASLLASKALHEAIAELNVRAGAKIMIARLGEGKDTRWFAHVDEDPFIGEGPAARTEEAVQQRARTAPDDFGDRLAKYKAAMNEAVKIARQLEGTELPAFARLDLNAVAFTIDRMAADCNTDLREVDEGN